MVMGPTHAMSGAAAALAAITVYNATIAPEPLHPTVAVLGTVMAAGAALAPDIDSRSSTVVRSFGIFGVIGYHIANSIGVTVHTASRTRYDSHVENGHRTFFHTTFLALLMGGIVALLTAPTNVIEVFGKEYGLGQFNAIILMGIFLNLSLAGIFEKQIKKARRTFGPYILMAFSFLAAVGIASVMPEATIAGAGTYAWLGIAVGFGWFIHLLGDAITKMGVPMAWPIKIRGHRWWDVSLPAFMRISAGGTFEYVILLPLFTLATVGLLAYNFLLYFGVLS